MTRRSGIALVLAALLALPAAGRAQRGGDPAEVLAAGEAAFEAGDFDLARDRLWSYLEATGDVTGPSRLPQARALYLIAQMEPEVAEARRHYQTIVEEYPAATEASQAAFRLGVLALMEGRPGMARERFRDLDEAYPFSRVQPELPLWIGRTYLEEDRYVDATDAFLDGYTKVKSQDLPTELPLATREALAAEYAWWLARTFREEGDVRTARQYYSLLVLDYPGSPQAEEARAALDAIDEGDLAERPTGRPERPRPVEPEAERVARAETERDEEPPLVRTAPPESLEEPEGAEPADETFEDEVAVAPPPDPTPGPEEVDPRPEPRAGEEVDPQPAPEARDEVEVAAEEPAVERPDRRADVGPAALARRPASEGRLFLQVGAFTSASRAADLSKRLKADGFDATIEIGVVDGQGFYRVRVGPFRMPAEEELVEANRRRLTDRGYPADVVRAEP